MFSIDKGFVEKIMYNRVHDREDIVRGYRGVSLVLLVCSFARSFGFNLLLYLGVSICKFTMSHLGKVSDRRDEYYGDRR